MEAREGLVAPRGSIPRLSALSFLEGLSESPDSLSLVDLLLALELCTHHIPEDLNKLFDVQVGDLHQANCSAGKVSLAACQASNLEDGVRFSVPALSHRLQDVEEGDEK